MPSNGYRVNALYARCGYRIRINVAADLNVLQDAVHVLSNAKCVGACTPVPKRTLVSGLPRGTTGRAHTARRSWCTGSEASKADAEQ